VAAELAARGIRRAWLVGGGQLAGAFRAAGLIGEIILSVIPVILGAGIPLFGAPSLTTVETLRLVKHRAFANGVVQFRYQNDAHHIEAPERH
jgi:riboflavin biosynthesis pyrimidine reductase